MVYELSNVGLIDYMKTFNRKNIINSLSNDKIDPIYLDNISESKIKLLKYLSQYGIITGSVALKLYGVLQRDVYDIDLICGDTGYNYLKTKHINYEFVDNYFRHVPITDQNICCLGVSKHQFVKSKVDIFIKQDVYYNEYDGIRLQPLHDIINVKTKMFRRKDVTDLKEIVTRIENNQFIVKTKRSFMYWLFQKFHTIA